MTQRLWSGSMWTALSYIIIIAGIAIKMLVTTGWL